MCVCVKRGSRDNAGGTWLNICALYFGFVVDALWWDICVLGVLFLFLGCKGPSLVLHATRGGKVIKRRWKECEMIRQSAELTRRLFSTPFESLQQY